MLTKLNKIELKPQFYREGVQIIVMWFDFFFQFRCIHTIGLYMYIFIYGLKYLKLPYSQKTTDASLSTFSCGDNGIQEEKGTQLLNNSGS